MKKSLIVCTLLFSLLFAACDATNNSSNGSTIGDDTTSINGGSSSNTSNNTSISIPDYDANWQGLDFSTYGETFRNKLASLINGHGTKTAPFNKSDNDTLHVGARAAAYPNENSNTFVPFYHSTAVTTTTGSCNREHTWPDSRGGGLIENDPFIIRPTLTKDNSTRGNNFYGNEKSTEFDPKSIEGYEPARGESARVILYAATRYASKGLSLSNNPGDGTGLKTMGTLKTLLKWNLQYQPTAIEIQINNYLDKNGYGRNPFVDHPEYAKFIWDDNGVLTHSPVEGGIGGGSTEPEYKYDLVTSLDDIDGESVALVTAYSTAGPYYGMTTIEKSDTLPWYFTGVQTELNADKSKMACASNQLALFKVQSLGNGYYSLFSESKSEYLYSYISGTHYSISMNTTLSNDSGFSNKWSFTVNGQGFSMKSDKNVCFYYSDKGSFSGSSRAASVPVYLYK